VPVAVVTCLHTHSCLSFETRAIVYAGPTLLALVSFWTLNGLKRD
jgi:hypothetical protein